MEKRRNSFVKCGCSIYLFFYIFIFFYSFFIFYFLFYFILFFIFCNSANLICRGTNISKYLRESFGLRDNESRLYFCKFSKAHSFFFFFFFFFFSSSNVSTWYLSDNCPSKIFMLHVMNFRLFEDTDTYLVRGHDRCKSKLYPFSFSLFKYKTTTQNIKYR